MSQRRSGCHAAESARHAVSLAGAARRARCARRRESAVLIESVRRCVGVTLTGYVGDGGSTGRGERLVTTDLPLSRIAWKPALPTRRTSPVSSSALRDSRLARSGRGLRSKGRTVAQGRRDFAAKVVSGSQRRAGAQCGRRVSPLRVLEVGSRKRRRESSSTRSNAPRAISSRMRSSRPLSRSLMIGDSLLLARVAHPRLARRSGAPFKRRSQLIGETGTQWQKRSWPTQSRKSRRFPRAACG